MRQVIKLLLSLSAIVMIAVALPLFLIGCGDGDSGDDTDNGDGYNTPAKTATVANGGEDVPEVMMKGIKFDPQVITVKAGTTVTWTNEDLVDHTVTADDGTFDSGNIAEGDTYSYTFGELGTYEYSCILHPPNMTGTVIVE